MLSSVHINVYGGCMFIDDPRHWRLSKSGFSIKTGWATDSRIVASFHCPAAMDHERFQQWLDDAELICELHNAALAKQTWTESLEATA